MLCAIIKSEDEIKAVVVTRKNKRTQFGFHDIFMDAFDLQKLEWDVIQFLPSGIIYKIYPKAVWSLPKLPSEKAQQSSSL